MDIPKNKPIVIYGAGIVGRVIYNLLTKKGYKVEAMCDNNQKIKANDVVHIDKLKVKNPFFIIAASSLYDAINNLTNKGYHDWMVGERLLSDIDCLQKSPVLDFEKFTIETLRICHEGYTSKRFFIKSVDIVITQRCSLRCQGCSNLMQYYSQPTNYSTSSILTDIDKFLGVVDEVMETRVIGGEPFMNPDWPLVVKKLVGERKVKRVVIYTNGTILPPDLTALKNKKVIVIISNYGKLSRNLGKLVEAFKKENIFHHVLEIEYWMDCFSIKKQNRTDKKNEEIFRECACGRNLTTLMEGKIFRCPFSANAHILKAVPNFKEDWVGLDNRKKLYNFLYGITTLKTCNYCTSRAYKSKTTEPFFQIKKPLTYVRY